MIVIVPALLESDLSQLTAGIATAVAIPSVQRIQIDVTDDTLTPGHTVPISEIPLLDQRFHWEAHLMVADPRKYFADVKRVGFKTIIIQYESVAPEQLPILAAELRGMGLLPALGMYPSTSIDLAVAASQSFEQVTILGVEPGKQGQAMNQNALERTKQLSELLDADKLIEFDGGVTTENISAVAVAGAALIVAGSAIFGKGFEQSTTNFMALQQALS